MHYSFRCKNCGHLETSDNAGECEHPLACRVCSEGVSFDKKGNKTIDKDNWENLHEATDSRLKELGITREEVIEHIPALPTVISNNPQNVVREATESTTVKSKVSKK